MKASKIISIEMIAKLLDEKLKENNQVLVNFFENKMKEDLDYKERLKKWHSDLLNFSLEHKI